MAEYEAARAVAVAFEARVILADWAAGSPVEMDGWHLMDVHELHDVCDPNTAFDQALINTVGYDAARGTTTEEWYAALNDAMEAYAIMWLTDADSTAS